MRERGDSRVVESFSSVLVLCDKDSSDYPAKCQQEES